MTLLKCQEKHCQSYDETFVGISKNRDANLESLGEIEIKDIGYFQAMTCTEFKRTEGVSK